MCRVSMCLAVLSLATALAYAAPGEVTKTPTGWNVSWDGKPVLSYSFDASFPKPWVDPLMTPAGHNTVLTSPPDHVHHRGLMFAWGNIGIEGEPADYHLIFWGEEGDPHTLGRIVPDAAREPEVTVTDDAVRIVTCNLWLRNSDDLLVLRERRELCIHKPTTGRAYLLTWRTEQTPEMNITIGPTPGLDVSYYGLGYRSSPDMDHGLFVNSNGRREVAGCYGDRADWLAYQGLAEPVRGVAMFDHPDNPRYPTGWFLMNDFGYITASLPAFEPYPLPKGRTLTLTYGVLVFDGAIDEKFVDGQYDEWLQLNPAKHARQRPVKAEDIAVSRGAGRRARQDTEAFAMALARRTAKPSYDPVAPPSGYNLVDSTSGQPQHHALWFTYGKIRPAAGDPIDFWSEGGPRETTGEVTTESVERHDEGDLTTLLSRHHWRRASGGPPLIDERRRVEVDTSGSEATLITFTTEQRALEDLTLLHESNEKVSYYGLCLQMLPDLYNGLVVNANGSVDRVGIEGEPADWCAYATDVRPARGVAIFDHPTNPRHPNTYFTLPSGFLSTSLVAIEDYALKKGDTLRLTYGILVFDGDLHRDFIDKQYRRWCR